jgi:hypothetical protein
MTEEKINRLKIIFLIGMVFVISFNNCVNAKQILPKDIQQITTTISAPLTGEKGKLYFRCSSGQKCSTEDATRDYYQKQGYKVMRGEVTFWQGMFALAFYDEIFAINRNPCSDIPYDMFSPNFYPNRKESIDKKYEYLKKTNLSEFINKQLTAHEKPFTRLLIDAPIDKSANCVEFFKTPIVQEFLTKIKPAKFAKIVYRIAQNVGENRAGTPDFVIWNEKEMIFVEVKREKEMLRDGQITWLEFLIKNNIPSSVTRVKGIN